MTQKETTIRYMVEIRPIGQWFASYELVGKFVKGETTGITPMERLYEVINNEGGIFESSNFRYFVEHRAPKKDGNLTRYAQFRISKKEKKDVFIPGCGRLLTV